MREVIYQDREDALEALRLGNYVLEFCSDELRADKEIVMLEMEMDGIDRFETALEFASEELRADREVVLAALKWDGYSIRYASEALKNDRELVMVAVQNNIYGPAFSCISKAFQTDMEIVLEALNCNGSIFEDIPEALQNIDTVQFVRRLQNSRGFDGIELLGDEDDEDKINHLCAKHARDWQAIKQALQEKQGVLVNLFADPLPDGPNFYNAVIEIVLNQREIEPHQLPMLEIV